MASDSLSTIILYVIILALGAVLIGIVRAGAIDEPGLRWRDA
jgi:hypothetical protein